MVSLTLTKQAIAEMTGRKLLESIGFFSEHGSWRDNDLVPFILNGTKWHAYTTSGRGRQSGTTYVHIYRNNKLRIVDSEGHDTGARVDVIDHLRGKMSDPLQTYTLVH